MKIFCVIPAYNEGEKIIAVLNDVKKVVDVVVVVDDGSADKTFEYAKETNVVVLRHVINRGQGAALRTGTEYSVRSGADIVVHFDADGQFLSKEIAEVISPIVKGEADVVFGSRFMGKKSDMPWQKEFIIMPIAQFINRFIFGVRTTDPQSGFRAMNRQVASSMEIYNDRMAHCSEILVKVFSGGWRVKEVPITVVYHEFGQKFGGGLKILKDLFLAKLLS